MCGVLVLASRSTSTTLKMTHLPSGETHGLADALQLHHVFESEGMFGLSEGGKSKRKYEKREKKTAHEEPPAANG